MGAGVRVPHGVGCPRPGRRADGLAGSGLGAVQLVAEGLVVGLRGQHEADEPQAADGVGLGAGGLLDGAGLGHGDLSDPGDRPAVDAGGDGR